MASITLGGNPAETNGSIPSLNTTAANFTLTAVDLSSKSLNDYDGFRKILNIFPSVDTGVCAASARKFNEEASSDLPFAQSRFCAAEGLDNFEMLSDFKDGSFGKEYGLEITKSVFTGLHSRVVLVLNDKNEIIYSEQVPEIGQEPDYASALNALG